MKQIHFLQFDDFHLDPQIVVDELPGEKQDYLYDFIEELIEDGEEEIGRFFPTAQWIRLAVKPVDESRIMIGSQTYEDSYLVERLAGVEDVFLYYVHVSEAMWKYYWTFDDPLDSYLFNRVMSTCLNQGFLAIVGEIADLLPDYCIGQMDNPGITSRWDLKGQRDLVESFKIESNGEAEEIPLRSNNLFENQYSYMGLIYGKKNPDQEGRWRDKLSIAELAAEFRDSAGF